MNEVPPYKANFNNDKKSINYLANRMNDASLNYQPFTNVLSNSTLLSPAVLIDFNANIK